MATQSTTATILRSDVGDRAVLFTSLANIGDPLEWSVALPAGFGDCDILSLQFMTAEAATNAIPLTNRPGVACIIANGGEYAVPVGVVPLWGACGVGGVGATPSYAWHGSLELVHAVRWSQQGALVMLVVELDSNAVPTVDYFVYARVRRLRDRQAVSGYRA